jgi:hypothetical protein
VSTEQTATAESQTVARAFQVDFDKARQALPGLGGLEGTPADGPLAGWLITARHDCTWSAQRASTSSVMLDSRELTGTTLSFNAGDLQVYLTEVHVSFHAPFSEMRGLARSIQVTPVAPRLGPQILRSYLMSAGDFDLEFPSAAIDTRTKSWTKYHCSFQARDIQIEVFRVANLDAWILQASASIDPESFEKVTGNLRILLTYILGTSLRGPTCMTSLDDSGSLVTATWHPGQTGSFDQYRPTPVGYADLQNALKVLQLPRDLNPLAQLAKCGALAKVLDQPKLLTPLEYLVRWPQFPLEMRGVVLAVAIESLTKIVLSAHRTKAKNRLPQDVWGPLQAGLESFIRNSLVGEQAEQADYFVKKTKYLNEPSNSKKLTEAFTLIGISLSDRAVEAIELRNRLLHEGRILDPDAASHKPESWRIAYEAEMQMYTAANHLLLKYLGYSGPLYDWAATDYEGAGPKFIAVAGEAV